MAGEDRWMAERLTPDQSSQLLIAYRSDLQLYWWAKGDLNPHVPKDTGT
jgi:hypothetical protein